MAVLIRLLEVNRRKKVNKECIIAGIFKAGCFGS